MLYDTNYIWVWNTNIMRLLVLLMCVCVALVWTARRHAPTRHKIESILHGHVSWGSNTSMLRATPAPVAPVEKVKVLPPPWLDMEAPEKDMGGVDENGVNVTTAVPVVETTPAPIPIVKREMNTMVTVLSRRSAFETRKIIRETWASGHDNVFFAVGACCPIPPSDRKKWSCIRAKATSIEDQTKWDTDCAKEDLKMAEEEQTYMDIIRMPDIDVYRHLPQKVKFAYIWGLEHTTAKWFLKTDDDSVVRVDTLDQYLTDTYDASGVVVIGKIINHGRVPRGGKWAEPHYKPSVYPKFPIGSVGHVVSRPVASYIAENSDKLFNYQGEDVSIGIWLDESPLKSKVKWVTSKHMTNSGNCKDTGKWVMGHNIKPATMRKCFAHKDEIAEKKATVDTAIVVKNVSPFSLDLAKRFDIIVKTVYAVEWLEKGTVSDFTTNMYNNHLKVWNNFQEPCKFRGQKDWFDASKPCVKKASAQDFTTSFQKTIQSLKETGFDNSKSIVPVTNSLFPLNGAHRIAAAIALGMDKMPVQLTSSSHTFNWDAKFFTKKGFDTKYSDFARTQFLMHINNRVESVLSFLQYHYDNVHAVVLFPSVRNQKVDFVKTIIKEYAKIITEHAFWLKNDAADMFVQQIYPNEAWVSNGAWGKTKYCFPSDTKKFPIRVFFISTPLPLKKVLGMKQRIRELYKMGKHSIHITDTHLQAMDVAKLVLNKHSLRYINYTKWTSPLQRKKIKCNPPQNADENARFYIDGNTCALEKACSSVPRIFTESKTHWSSVEDLWLALDTANIKYALLRNFENGVIHPNDAHPDVDILLESLEPACCVMTMYGGPEAKCKRNVQNQGQHVTIRGQKVKLDIRILGDKYYDDKWTQDMLTRRVRGHVPNSLAWSISPEDYLFSLIYHALVHKKKISKDYPARICAKATGLGYVLDIHRCSDRKYLQLFVSKWMSSRGYTFVKPLDKNVPYNPPNGRVLDKPAAVQTGATVVQTAATDVGNELTYDVQKECSWPPPLYPNKDKTSQKYMKRLTQIQNWAESNKDSALVYLVSGGLLGMYRDGALISYDSDIDIRYAVSNKQERAELSKLKLGITSLNDMKKWGDHWNGFWYIEPEEVNDDLIDKFNRNYICKPSRSSPIQTHIHARKEIEYTYGPFWFIRMSFKGMRLDKFIEYVNPSYWFHKDWAEMIKTIKKIDSDGNHDVTVDEISRYVEKDGIDIAQYNLQISQRDRCRASRMLNWILEYNKSPYPIVKKYKYNWIQPLFVFAECDS